jgi:hypothetical protein
MYTYQAFYGMLPFSDISVRSPDTPFDVTDHRKRRDAHVNLRDLDRKPVCSTRRCNARVQIIAQGETQTIYFVNKKVACHLEVLANLFQVVIVNPLFENRG